MLLSYRLPQTVDVVLFLRFRPLAAQHFVGMGHPVHRVGEGAGQQVVIKRGILRELHSTGACVQG